MGEDGDVPAPVRPLRVRSSGSATLEFCTGFAPVAASREAIVLRGVDSDLGVTSLITRACHEMFRTVSEQSPYQMLC